MEICVELECRFRRICSSRNECIVIVYSVQVATVVWIATVTATSESDFRGNWSNEKVNVENFSAGLNGTRDSLIFPSGFIFLAADRPFESRGILISFCITRPRMVTFPSIFPSFLLLPFTRRVGDHFIYNINKSSSLAEA